MSRVRDLLLLLAALTATASVAGSYVLSRQDERAVVSSSFALFCFAMLLTLRK